MDDFQLKQLIKEESLKAIREYFTSFGFTDRKLTDTPSDANQVVPRKYVTMNGTSANRPRASVVGQQYFDTSLASGRGQTVTWNGTGFVDGTGTYV